MNECLEVHDAILRLFLATFHGYEVKTEGDAFMCAFSTPMDAVRYCIAVQQALLAWEWPERLIQQ